MSKKVNEKFIFNNPPKSNRYILLNFIVFRSSIMNNFRLVWVNVLMASFFLSYVHSAIWDNSYDHALHRVCPANSAISSIESRHNNHYEDRVWDLRCKNVGSRESNCQWSCNYYIIYLVTRNYAKIQSNKSSLRHFFL